MMSRGRWGNEGKGQEGILSNMLGETMCYFRPRLVRASGLGRSLSLARETLTAQALNSGMSACGSRHKKVRSPVEDSYNGSRVPMPRCFALR